MAAITALGGQLRERDETLMEIRARLESERSSREHFEQLANLAHMDYDELRRQLAVLAPPRGSTIPPGPMMPISTPTQHLHGPSRHCGAPSATI